MNRLPFGLFTFAKLPTSYVFPLDVTSENDELVASKISIQFDGLYSPLNIDAQVVLYSRVLRRSVKGGPSATGAAEGVGVEAGVEADGLDAAGVVTTGVVTAGVETTGVVTTGVETAGVVTAGVVTAGVETAGVEAAGVEAAGVEAAGVAGVGVELEACALSVGLAPSKGLSLAIEYPAHDRPIRMLKSKGLELMLEISALTR